MQLRKISGRVIMLYFILETSGWIFRSQKDMLQGGKYRCKLMSAVFGNNYFGYGDDTQDLLLREPLSHRMFFVIGLLFKNN